LGLLIPVGLLVSPEIIFAQKYRVILPPRPLPPPALNNTVQAQTANQNVNFNTGSSIQGVGNGGAGELMFHLGVFLVRRRKAKIILPGLGFRFFTSCQLLHSFSLVAEDFCHAGGVGQGGFGNGANGL